MLGWFCGMLLLPAKCPRPLGRWENSLWKTLWRTIQRASTSLCSSGCISSDFNGGSIKTSSIWQESTSWYFSWVWIDRGTNLERRYSDCGFGRFVKVGRIRNFRRINEKEVVVLDLASQWIQSYPCKTKSSHETKKSLLKFLEPSHRPKVVYTDNSMDFG